jgi:hypothetical protein
MLLNRLMIIAGALMLLNPAARAVNVCPFCDAPTLMMAEQVEQSDHLLLGKWQAGRRPTDTVAGGSTFEILKVSKSLGDRFAPGQTLELPHYIAGSDQKNYLLMGPDGRLADWHIPQEVSDSAWDYLSSIPTPVVDPEQQVERLAFFLDYLEHPDLIVSNDAYGEFAAAPYEIITPLKDRIPREKVRQWLLDPATPVTRTGLYGLLLGQCGTEDDALAMEQKILVPEASFRLGIEGVMAGYLMIRGEAGLQVLEEKKMRATTFVNAEGEEVRLPFAEVYAAMQTLRFMWTYEPDVIDRERLKQSMRILLERPELSDLVIADLARWKDWDCLDRMVAMYDEEKFNIPSVKRAIVRYLYYCSKDVPSSDSETADVPEHVEKATAALKVLEEKDPRTVGDAKRYLIR